MLYTIEVSVFYETIGKMLNKVPPVLMDRGRLDTRRLFSINQKCPTYELWVTDDRVGVPSTIGPEGVGLKRCLVFSFGKINALSSDRLVFTFIPRPVFGWVGILCM